MIDLFKVTGALFVIGYIMLALILYEDCKREE